MGDVNVKEAWSDVGTQFSGLGDRLKGHFSHPAAPGEGAVEDAGEAATAVGDAVDSGATVTTESTGAEGSGATDAGAADALKSALKHLGEALDGVVEAIGGAAKDPAVAEDVRHVGQSLVTALAATFSDASGEIRKAFNRNRPGDTEPTAQDAAPAQDAVPAEGAPPAQPQNEPPTQPSGE
jgi:hypothetical protein